MEYAQSLFEAISDSAVLLDKSGRVLDWNNGAATLFGYSKKDAIGKPINFIFVKLYHNKKNGNWKRPLSGKIIRRVFVEVS
jgi:PAS domain S-box-containing protein